jgi:hypothetical protein
MPITQLEDLLQYNTGILCVQSPSTDIKLIGQNWNCSPLLVWAINKRYNLWSHVGMLDYDFTVNNIISTNLYTSMCESCTSWKSENIRTVDTQFSPKVDITALYISYFLYMLKTGFTKQYLMKNIPIFVVSQPEQVGDVINIDGLNFYQILTKKTIDKQCGKYVPQRRSQSQNIVDILYLLRSNSYDLDMVCSNYGYLQSFLNDMCFGLYLKNFEVSQVADLVNKYLTNNLGNSNTTSFLVGNDVDI